jgi:TolB-like protein/DNA-binding winged helix-turn-helix (wHTH) protein/tetratricopeptide (TPR) repeat protein
VNLGSLEGVLGSDFRVGPWLVEPSLNTISDKGAKHHLEPKVMEVLVYFARHPGECLSKEKLLQEVWPETFVTDDALTRCIFELRRVFEDEAKEPRIIQTIHKRGYRLIAPVAPVKEAEEPQRAESGQIRAAKIRKSGIALLALLAVTLVFVLLGTFHVVDSRNWLTRKSTPQIHSLAVLPLRNLSSDPNEEYFSDGMTDALITDLAQISSVKVISRTSIMRYKKTEKSLPEIARELNVDAIIEGTVQRSGDRVRITAQLIHGPSDKHLWASSYERDLRDVFALQRDVTDEITRQIQARVTTPNLTSLAHPRPVDPKVLEAYIEGNYHLRGYGRDGGDDEIKKAQAYYQQAIDADPNFAAAYIGLANAHKTLLQGSKDDLAIMRRAAEKAVELAPSSSDAWVALADARAESGDWNGAEEEFRRAIALNPNNAQAHHELGHILDETGRLDEGWKEYQMAQEVDPNQDHLALALYRRGQFDRAIEIRQKIALRDPGEGTNHYFLAQNYAQKGMYKEFVQETSTSFTLFGMPEVANRLQRAYDESGYQGALRQWAKDLEHLAATKQVYLPGVLAQVYTALGDKDRAFYWLEQLRQHHDLALADPTGFFKIDPWLAPLRSDPRFNDFLRRAGHSP